MNGIKFILIFGLFLCLLSYLRFFRSVLLDRAIAVGLMFLGVIFVVSPDLTTSLAHILGVGRGADLLFYLFSVLAIFLFILLYSQIAQISAAQTEIIRTLAMQGAKDSEPEGQGDDAREDGPKGANPRSHRD